MYIHCVTENKYHGVCWKKGNTIFESLAPWRKETVIVSRMPCLMTFELCSLWDWAPTLHEAQPPVSSWERGVQLSPGAAGWARAVNLQGAGGSSPSLSSGQQRCPLCLQQFMQGCERRGFGISFPPLWPHACSPFSATPSISRCWSLVHST